MLRSTDRLQQFCQGCNYLISERILWSNVTEVDLLVQEAPIEDAAPAFPHEFRLNEFRQHFSADDFPRGTIRLFAPSVGGIARLVPMRSVSRANKSQRADILWLSEEIFLSTINFPLIHNEGDHHGLHLFQYQMLVAPVQGPELECFVYSLWSFTATTQQQLADLPASDLPLHFFRHLVAGMPADQLKCLKFRPGAYYFPPTHCMAFLSILPPSVDNEESTPRTTVSFDGLDEEQLRALTILGYSPHAQLVLGTRAEVSQSLFNQILRECQNLLHLEIPTQLINFDGDDVTFATNPQFRSLTIPRVNEFNVSSLLMDGLAFNRGLNHLILEYSGSIYESTRWPSLSSTARSNLEYLFQHVLPKCCFLRRLTLNISRGSPLFAFPFGREMTRLVVDSSAQAAGLHRFGSVMSINITYTCFSGKVIVIPPNENWDKLVSPSLVLNWCRSQGTESAFSGPSQHPALIGRAISQTNQNVVYKKTSNMKPREPRPANASVVYSLLSQSYFPTYDESELGALHPKRLKLLRDSIS
jgi:hypothetical protein